MGVDLEVLDLANREPVRADGKQGLYFPDLATLRRTGVLADGRFLPFELVAEGKGLALVSRYSTDLSYEKQLTLLCLRTAGQGERMSLIFSSGWHDRRQGLVAPRVGIVGFGQPPISNSIFGAFSVRFRWWLSAEVDGRVIATGKSDGGVVYDNANSAIPADRRESHKMVALSEGALEALAAAKELKVTLVDDLRISTAAFSLDENSRSALPLLPRNCVDVLPPRSGGISF